jgi:hypothetical protein
VSKGPRARRPGNPQARTVALVCQPPWLAARVVSFAALLFLAGGLGFLGSDC